MLFHFTAIRVQKLAATEVWSCRLCDSGWQVAGCPRSRPVAQRSPTRGAKANVAAHDQGPAHGRGRRGPAREALCRRDGRLERRARSLSEHGPTAVRGEPRHLSLSAAARRAPRPRPPRAHAPARVRPPGATGVYETTITHPRAFRRYLLEQLNPLLTEYGAGSRCPSATRKSLTRMCWSAPTSSPAATSPPPTWRGISRRRNCRRWATRSPTASGSSARASRGRCRCSTRPASTTRCAGWCTTRAATGGNVQQWILLTNYHRYVDQFIRWGRDQLAGPTLRSRGSCCRAARASSAAIRRAGRRIVASYEWHRFQMPAYHLVAPDGEGVTLVNIGVGPSNAKNITDHLAVLRPNCWLMVGHCGGLRDTQRIGDYVAGARLSAPGPHSRRAGAAGHADPGAGRDPDRPQDAAALRSPAPRARR